MHNRCRNVLVQAAWVHRMRFSAVFRMQKQVIYHGSRILISQFTIRTVG